MKNLIYLIAAVWFTFVYTESHGQTARKDSLMFEVSPGNWLSYTQMTGYTTINPLTDELRWRSSANGMIGATSPYVLPISTATQTALNAKQNTLVAGTGITIVGSTINATATSRVFNNNVARSVNSNYTISATRDVLCTYSISISVTNPLLAGSSSGSAFLEYSTNAGSTWNTVSQVTNASSVALAVTIALTQPNTFVLSGPVPANALVRIRTTTAGTASVTYTLGNELYL